MGCDKNCNIWQWWWWVEKQQQLVCLLKSHAVWLARICLRCDQLAGLCMVLLECMVVLHVVVGGAYNQFIFFISFNSFLFFFNVGPP